MTGKKGQIIVKKMITYAKDSIKYSQSISYEEFLADEKLVGFTVFCLSQLGELVTRLDKEFYDNFSDVPWVKIKGLRNRIVHHYEGITFKTVWSILKNDVPELIKNLSAILEKLGESEEKPNDTKN